MEHGESGILQNTIMIIIIRPLSPNKKKSPENLAIVIATLVITYLLPLQSTSYWRCCPIEFTSHENAAGGFPCKNMLPFIEMNPASAAT